MARLQDFPTVTPTSSDKLLVVQSQSQGLVPYGSKLDSANPTGTGALSMNKASGSTIGSYSANVGQNNTVSGRRAFSEGYSNTASGDESHAEGLGTIANHVAQHTFGSYNVADTSTAASNARGNYVEIVGNGTGTNARANARTLDWSGNEVLAGDCTIKGNISLYDTITPSLVSLTYTQGVSYVSGGVYQVGKIIIVALRITLDANSGSTGTDIISGFPRPARTGTYSSPYVRFATINGSFAVYDTGILKGYSATAGTVLINGVYIAE